MRGLSRLLVTPILMLAVTSAMASAGVVLKLGDVLVAEPTSSSISVVDPATGVKTVISQGGLLSPANSTIGVALAQDGDIVVVNRLAGLIRVNPQTGTQSVLSQGGQFRDPWAIAVDKVTGYIYVADSGYDNDRPAINQAGKIIRVDPATGSQVLIASGSPCNSFPSNAACQNTTSAGSYLAHPYGIAIDYALQPGTIVVTDMGSFNGQGAVIRIQPVPNGTQTLLWGPASAVPAPQVPQLSPLGCPMGVTVEPNGSILTTAFTFPVSSPPIVPPPAGTFYGCAPPGIFRIDLISNIQTVVNANAPPWQPNHTYALGDVIRDETLSTGYVHRVVTAGMSQSSAPAWNAELDGPTMEGSVVWRNIGLGANWSIPFGVATEPAPTPSEPLRYNIIVGDEGHSMLFRLDAGGQFVPSPGPFVTDLNNVTSIDVITFTPLGGFTRGPVPSNGQPAGALPPTLQATLSLTTDVNATCRYDVQTGVAYGSMPNTFATTGSMLHATTVTGLAYGSSYTFYVRCADVAGNANTDDFVIAFSVASSSAAISSFAGTETPLFENGVWDSPGAWADLRKNNGAFAVGLNAQARRVTPTVAANQYSEITYDQDPGSFSWVGVTTRVQGAGNGSGYLAIVYAGEVRLYRVDDSGVLNFTQLASVSAAIGAAPRRLRMESQGNTHKVYFNGTLVISHTVTGLYSSGQPGIAASVFGGPQVKILSFEGGDLGAASSDTTSPVRINGQPVGILSWGTTQATLSLTTNENAMCRYGVQAGVAYGSMPNTFATTGSTLHATTVTGLTNGSSYTFYVRCVDVVGNANTDDFVIAFSVASSSAATSSFAGTETSLFENGVWDSPGAWADLRKDNGAFAVGPNAQARRVTPTLAANQYSEITYDQDPGSLSWVGVTTRVQGAGNGSGYLAIAYAGEVRLYQVDDSGVLNFTQLASASAAIGAAPRRLRMESEGNTHRVYFNGTLVISHTVTGLYSSGQPGIAASVFGGPQVKILSFEGGDLDAAPPVLSSGQPSGSLPTGTTQATLSLTTNEAAVCRYSTITGVVYGAMTSTFTTTGGTVHTTPVSGLVNGGSYSFFVRCQDAAANTNPSDFSVSFAVARSGLVAAYGFDEALGTTTLDASGNNLTGTLTNVTRSTAGKFGRALVFNGLNAWVTVADANALDLTTGMTLEAWVNPTATGGGVWRNVLMKERTGGEVYNLYANVDTNVPAAYVATQSAVLDARGTATVPLNTWTHLAATFDGATLRLFVNGTEVRTRAVAGALMTSTGALRIGGNSLWGEYFQGSLDEIRVYNRALSATEVQADMNTSVGGTPTVTINQAADQGDPSNLSPINFTVVFSAPVADFATGDVSLGGTAGATTAAVTGGPTTYNVAVSGMTASGTVTATIDAGIAHDAAGNGNGASMSTDNSVTYDALTLTVTINQSTGQGDPTNASSINFTVAFSSPVADFATGDVSLGGTAGATTAAVTGGPTTYTIAVSGMTGNGTVSATVGAGVAHNAGLNGNAASTSTDNTVTYDGTAPTVAINQAAGQGDPTNGSPINFTVVFSEPVANFATGDVSLGGTAGATTAAVTGGPTTYNVAASGMTTSGTVSATVGAGVAHDGAGNGNSASTSTDNTVTYDASALPSLSIDNVTVTEGNTGTANATFTVTLSVASSQIVTVNYATANGTAVAPGDYTPRSGVVTFPIGTTTQQVTVPVVGDTLSEANEQFTVNLSNPSGATIPSGQGTGTITDNDPLPSLSINNVTATEGNTGTASATFTVALSVASGQTVTVNFATTNATAIAPADYTATSGLLTFPAGTLTRQIVVPVVGDLLDENAETYAVNLSGATGATIGSAVGTGTITDNDATPSLTIDSVPVTEGNAGSTPATFTVTLSAVSGRQVTVNYATANNTATAASGDYTSVTTTLLTFAPGVTTRTIDVSVLGDTLYEAPETFRVNLTGATNATIATSQGTGTILNDDTPPSLTIGSPTVTETNSGSTTMTFVVSLSAVSGVGTTVNFATADGTATAGSDYTARTGTLTIATGSVSGNIVITRFGDTVPEADETLFVDLTGPTNATIAQSRGTGTLTDNDGTVTVTAPNTAATWTVGSARLITWTSSSSFTAGATFRVELSRNGGTTYELIAGSVPNATSTSGSYNWTVSGPATTQGRVRVTWTVNGRVTDISNTNFTIAP